MKFKIESWYSMILLFEYYLPLSSEMFFRQEFRISRISLVTKFQRARHINVSFSESYESVYESEKIEETNKSFLARGRSYFVWHWTIVIERLSRKNWAISSHVQGRISLESVTSASCNAVHGNQYREISIVTFKVVALDTYQKLIQLSRSNKEIHLRDYLEGFSFI